MVTVAGLPLKIRPDLKQWVLILKQWVCLISDRGRQKQASYFELLVWLLSSRTAHTHSMFSVLMLQEKMLLGKGLTNVLWQTQHPSIAFSITTYP